MTLAALNQAPLGAFEIGPDLTYRENLISSADVTKKPFTVTYHIKTGAGWSDGGAEDRRGLHVHLPGDGQESDRRLSVGEDPQPSRARQEDAQGVAFRAPEPDWREAFHMVLPRHAFAGEDREAMWQDTIDNPKTGEPIGSGPFLVERFDRGRQLILVRNPRYWGPHKAYLQRLVFRFVSPDAFAEALRRGDVDLIEPGNNVRAAAALELRRRPVRGIGVIPAPGTAWEHLEIRVGPGGHPALRNKLVRQALAYGIDREVIAEALLRELYEGAAAPKPLDSAVFLMDSPFYEPNWKRTTATDPHWRAGCWVEPAAVRAMTGSTPAAGSGSCFTCSPLRAPSGGNARSS